MRIESSVTSISWMPREAIEGSISPLIQLWVGHPDPPPPEVVHDVRQLLDAAQARVANQLRAWIDVEAAQVVGYGYAGGGHMAATRLRLGERWSQFPPVPFPDLRSEPEVGDGWVRFTQITGGRAGTPMPRRIRGRPFLRWIAPPMWSSLALTIHADGSSDFRMLGASSFPRHWIYDHSGRLVAQTAWVDFRTWYRQTTPWRSPWGEEESPQILTRTPSSLERRLSLAVMESEPQIKQLRPGETLSEQPAATRDVFVLLDGLVAVGVDGRAVTELGPGSVIGELALQQGSRQTTTLRAVTPCRVAVVGEDHIDRQALEQLARSRTACPRIRHIRVALPSFTGGGTGGRQAGRW